MYVYVCMCVCGGCVCRQFNSGKPHEGKNTDVFHGGGSCGECLLTTCQADAPNQMSVHVIQGSGETICIECC